MAKKELNTIKVALAQRKVSNKELAEHLNVKETTVSRWCTNDSQPHLTTLFEIANYLKVSVCSLLVKNL